MENKILLFDFDGIYKTQDFYQGHNCRWIDTQKLIGTNSYCDIYAQKNLQERLKDIQLSKLSFLGSGNYHYISLFLTQKIQEDYALILFDNHSDMQKPVFDELLSCGGWLRTALLKQKRLKQVAIVGTSEHSLHMIDKSLKEKVILYPYNKIEKTPNWHLDLSKKIRYPVYISVDKDVFCKKVAETNWNHGEMEPEEFLNAFETIANTHTVIGMDVCGEYSMAYREPFAFEKANRKNNRANQKLLQLCQQIIA